MAQELTFKEIAPHTDKSDCYMVLHDKVYNVSAFIDEHPGGEEVLLDVGGQDATEAFEDVGHSDEARETLKDMLVGTLKRLPGDPAPKIAQAFSAGDAANQPATGMGSVALYFIMLSGAGLAYAGYKYLESQKEEA